MELHAITPDGVRTHVCTVHHPKGGARVLVIAAPAPQPGEPESLESDRAAAPAAAPQA